MTLSSYLFIAEKDSRLIHIHNTTGTEVITPQIMTEFKDSILRILIKENDTLILHTGDPKEASQIIAF